jgi:hypothetical protein
MNYDLFHSMTIDEAREYLASFLVFGANRCNEIISENVHFTIEIDFSLETVGPVFHGLLGGLRTVPRQPDPSLPDFVLNSETYKENLFDFDEPSKLIVLAAGYYLGETFVRNYEQLVWSIGNNKYQEANMPVVAGFRAKLELAPVLVGENMLRGVISGTSDSASIDRAIEAWKGLV